jgi:hypothetical protein
MHNTLVLDGRDHATPGGPFHWQTRVDARFLVARTSEDIDFAVGTHDAYGDRRHLRAVLALHGIGWLIIDRVVTNCLTEAQAWWHLHPSWVAAVQGRSVELIHASGRRLALVTTAQDLAVVTDPAFSSYAPEYGRTEPATTLVARHTAAVSFDIGTFIPAAASKRGDVSIAQVKESTFEIHSGQDDIQVSLAFPLDGKAQPQADWPQPCITRLELSRTR